MAPSYASVERQTFRIADLEDAPYNARTISQRALGGLTASLDRFGLLVLPVVNLVRGKKPRLVAGHQKVRIAREKEVEEIECVVVRWSREKERQANFALNNTAIQGEFVPELTQRILDQIREAAGDQADELFDGLQFDMLVRTITRQATAGEEDRTVRPGKVADDDDEPAPTQTKATSKRGKVYQLGDHRLLVSKLVGPISFEATLALGSKKTAVDSPSPVMAFTHLSTTREADFDDGFVNTHLLAMLQNCAGGIYVATRMSRLPMIQRSFVELGGHLSNTLVAYEPETDGAGPYEDITIPVLYGWRDGVTRAFFGDAPGNVLKLKGETQNGRLPVQIAEAAILNSSKVGEHIFDSNVTHGATVIAAEKCGRRLVGIVPTARQCDRIRQRWTRFAKGEKANWRTATKELRR